MYTLDYMLLQEKKDKKANFPGSAYLPVGTLVPRDPKSWERTQRVEVSTGR